MRGSGGGGGYCGGYYGRRVEERGEGGVGGNCEGEERQRNCESEENSKGGGMRVEVGKGALRKPERRNSHCFASVDSNALLISR